MRRLLLTVPVLAAGLACTSQPSSPAPRPESETAGRLEIGDELAGRALHESADGPWRIRTSRGGGGGGDARPSGGPAEKALRFATSEVAEGGIAAGAAPMREMADDPGDAPSTGGPATSPADGAFDAVGEPLADERLRRVAEARDELDVAEDARFDRRPAASKSAASAPVVQNLKAGSTDDNADYQAYLEFLATWVDRKDIRDLYQPTDVADRRFVRVVDATGRPVPGAVVSIVDELADRVLWTATTYGDGRIPYYPRLLPPAPGASEVLAMTAGSGEERGGLLIEAIVRDADGTPRGVRAPWDGVSTEVQVALTDVVPVPDPVQLDVCFVIDTTGSMGDEIESIKASLLKMTEQLRGLDREFDLRYSAVLYRDIGDDYVTATHPFTEDIEAFDKALGEVSAAGGGDGPESLNQAVAHAVEGVDWRDGAAKVAFLIADAPPHMDYAGDVPYGESARAALARGIRIHSVAASGLDPVGTLVFRQIAQLTRGKFIFIEYGTPEAAAASHGVAGAVKRNNLEDILFEQIRDEVATFGR